MSSRIILFGTPAFAIPIAEAIRDVAELIAVVTPPDKPVGRNKTVTPSALKVWASEHDILVLQPEKLSDAFAEKLKQHDPLVGVIASYGKIIPKEVIDAFTKGIINVHPSLLPRHRGASPIQATILAGDSVTGITLMLTDEKMDHGPILVQKHFPIWPAETKHELQERLSEHAASMLKETLPAWIAGDVELQEQNHSEATYTKILTRKDGKIDWSQPATMIERQLRALTPWPGTFTILPSGKRLKVLYVGVVTSERTDPKETGTIRRSDSGEPEIRVADAWIRLLRVQPEGKAEMSGDAFLNGHQDLIGQRIH